jgi:site-specific recombinase XerD
MVHTKSGDIMTFKELRERLNDYTLELRDKEKSANTVKAYAADIEHFAQWAEGRDGDTVTKADVIAYKEYLRSLTIKRGKREKLMATSTINRKIISINKYLKWAGAADAAGTKQLKQQQRATLEDVISKAEFERLLRAANDPPEQARKAGIKPDRQLYMIMITFAYTGIRYNELQYFTVESLRAARKTGKITVVNKGKERAIPIRKSLINELTEYCKEKDISSGYIFGTRNGTPLRNEQVAKRLKRLAGYARIPKSKVHPHSFRHYFAKDYMQTYGRLDKLQSILGHADISTTTIYTTATAKELADDLEKMDPIPKWGKTKGRR